MGNDVTISTPSDCEIVITREFRAPLNLVFDACTRPALLKRWLTGPPGWSMTVCEIDRRVGGNYRYVWRHTDGTEMGMGGVFRELLRPERIVRTELFDDDWTGGEALSTMVLNEHRTGVTTLTNTLLYSSRRARDGCLKTGMKDGMAASYISLDALLASSIAP